MKKITITIFFIVLIVTSLIFLLYYKHDNEHFPFRCDGQMLNQVATPTGNVELNAFISVIFTTDRTGIMYTTGSVKDKNTLYTLQRQTFFNITPAPLKGTNDVYFTHETVHPTDNTPDNLWHNVILPQVNNVKFNVEMKIVNHNALLVRGLSTPFIICVKPYK
ncbi:MAG: hypothetical protein ACRDE7_14720 [Sphingobacterium sp.]